MNYYEGKPNDIYFNDDNINVLNNNIPNNIPKRNNYFYSTNMNQKNIPNKMQYFQNNNINIANDKRLELCLNYLGLKKYIINFQRNEINFDNFLSLTNKDFAIIQIPNNVVNKIQKFIIAYLKFGSLYTLEEIKKFFYINRQRQKGNNPNNNINNRMNRGNRGRSYTNKNNIMNNNRNYMMMNNINNYQMNNKNVIKYNNTNTNNKRNYNRPKSHNNKPINYDFLMDNHSPQNNIYQNNYQLMNNQNLNIAKINPEHYNNNMNNNRNNMKNITNNNKTNVNRKNNFIKNNTKNTNITSIYSSSNNMNYIAPSIDNCSHMAIEGNNSIINNIIKMNQFREINNDNFDNLKRNLSKNTNSKNKNNNSRKINQNKIINNNRKQPNQNNLIDQMSSVLKRIQIRKENNLMTQSNAGNIHKENSSFGNSNKGYHSDGYLNEQKKMQQYNDLINSKSNSKYQNNNNSYKNLNHINNNINNNLSKNSGSSTFNNRNNILNGYEINSYYTGDTSRLDSLRGENKITPDIKKIEGKNGKIYYSKANKVKKINEEQTRKIEQILGYNSSSVMAKTPINYANKIFNVGGNNAKKNKGMLINNFDNYNIEENELYSINKNNSKSNLTNNTNIQNNNYVKPFDLNSNYFEIDNQLMPRKNNNNLVMQVPYSSTVNRFIKQKNIVSQGKLKHKNISNNNKFNNTRVFNNFNNNKGNISSNFYDNNDIIDESKNMNFDNIMGTNYNRANFQKNNNNNSRGRRNNGPIQIQIKNAMKINNNYDIKNNNNNKIRNNNFIEKNTNNKNINKKVINNNIQNNKNFNPNKIFSVDNKKVKRNYQIPNNYVNTFINVNNYGIQKKRNAKSFDITNREYLNIGVYPGVHNINNNINNININYDTVRFPRGFNNFMDFDMGINYQSQNNFYQPNNAINNNELFFDEII